MIALFFFALLLRDLCFVAVRFFFGGGMVLGSIIWGVARYWGWRIRVHPYKFCEIAVMRLQHLIYGTLHCAKAREDFLSERRQVGAAASATSPDPHHRLAQH